MRKVDEKLMSSREMQSRQSKKNKSQSKNRRSIPEPYTGVKDIAVTKKVEDHF